MNILRKIGGFFLSIHNAMVEARMARAKYMANFYKKHGYMPTYSE